MRFTPIGIPIINFEMIHQSRQIENGVMRDVEVNIPVIALGDLVKPLIDKTTQRLVQVTGFLCNKSKKSTKVVLHANNIVFI